MCRCIDEGEMPWLQMLESQLKLKEEQMATLHSQTPLLLEIDPDKSQELELKKTKVEER